MNKYGLSRNIPIPIKRSIRQDCGFGCVLCGNAIFQYEHIDPEFADSKEHDPEKIALLCGSCHDKVTRGIWSKQMVKEARTNPICKQEGFSIFSLDVSNAAFFIEIGQTKFKNLQTIIEIDGQQILGIKFPEEPSAPPRISAKFFDRDNVEIAAIEENEWKGSVDAFDIETVGKKITIRNAKKKVDLVIGLEPPNLLRIESLNLQYNNTKIIGSAIDGFEVNLPDTSVKIPSEPTIIQKAPFWLSIRDGKINLGSDKVANFFGRRGEESELPGHIQINGARVETTTAEEAGISPRPGAKPGTKIMKVKTTGAGKGITINIQLPSDKNSK